MKLQNCKLYKMQTIVKNLHKRTENRVPVENRTRDGPPFCPPTVETGVALVHELNWLLFKKINL